MCIEFNRYLIMDIILALAFSLMIQVEWVCGIKISSFSYLDYNYYEY